MNYERQAYAIPDAKCLLLNTDNFFVADTIGINTFFELHDIIIAAYTTHNNHQRLHSFEMRMLRWMFDGKKMVSRGPSILGDLKVKSVV